MARNNVLFMEKRTDKCCGRSGTTVVMMKLDWALQLL